MLTQCPHCETVFRVNAEQLDIAAGRVRCGQCSGVFDAHAHVYDRASESAAYAGVPTKAPDRGAATAEAAASADDWPEADTEAAPYVGATRDADDWQPEQALATPPAETDLDEIPPPRIVVAPVTPRRPIIEPLNVAPASVLAAELTPPPTAAPPRYRLGWGLLAALLMLTLVAQYLYFARQDLAQYPALRPVLQRLCAALECSLPLRHAPARIELLSRDVITHPRIRAALLINATFVNRADFIQAYPVLQISLSGDNGTVVAMRRFQPAEYLPPGIAVAAGLAPGVPVHVVLELAEPSRPAASFQFEFL